MAETFTQIYSDEIPSAEAITLEPLLPKYKRVKQIEWSIFFLILLAGGIAAYFFIEEIPYWVFLIALGLWLLWVAYIFTSIHFGFLSKGYAIRNKDIHYRTGWLGRKITTVPICRIQHLEVKQSFVAKSFNMAKLEIYTAGDSSNDLSVRGVSFEKAQQIKAFLSEKIKHNE